ncbi:hypothetical protein M3Y97_00831000 [Aphelenchoides bicaudatus]|nr:hypothetical protein M3Y97_00831000 [Aphelenchoides bicaudatus]
MSVFVPQANYNEIEGRKRSSTRRKTSSVLVKLRSEDSDKMIQSLSSHIISEQKWPLQVSGSTPRKISSYTMNESILFMPPSPAATSMTASQLQQWLVPNQQFPYASDYAKRVVW